MDYDRETLVAELRTWGVTYLAPSDAVAKIDISFEVANEDHSAFISAIRELKESLSLNIEEASPADFIPIPAGYRERSKYVGRYGQLDVFHYDLHSTALSKVERGTETISLMYYYFCKPNESS